MIDFLVGTIKHVRPASITLLCNGMGFYINMPRTKNLVCETERQIMLYVHWNQENGPSFYGFNDEYEREVFLLILLVPKIGPKIAINILSQTTPTLFLEAVSTKNISALSTINGIGPKKAEQIVNELKDKIQKFIASNELSLNENTQLVMLNQLDQALTSLGYTRTEITDALEHLHARDTSKDVSFDVKLRALLTYLSKRK